MSKGKFKFNGVQKQKGRPTIVNGIEGQRYVVNKYLENLMSQQSVGRSDDYRVYTSVSEYQEYDAYADETLSPEQQPSAGGAGAYEQGQQDWSGQEQPVPDEQRWSQQGYEQQMSGQQPGMQDSPWGQQGYAQQNVDEQPGGMQDSPWGQSQGYDQQASTQQNTQQSLVNESPWGQPKEQDDQAPAQQQNQNQPWGAPSDQPVAQPQPQPQPISQSPVQDQVQSREQQSSSQSMLRNLFSEGQPQSHVADTQSQPAESMAPPQPAPAEHQQSAQESQDWQGEQQSSPVHRNSQEIKWSGPQKQPSPQEGNSPQEHQALQGQQLPQQPQAPQQQPQLQHSPQLAPLQPPQHQFAQPQQQTGKQRPVDPQEQQQWHRVPQSQPVQPQAVQQKTMRPQQIPPQPVHAPEQQTHQESEQPAQSRRREQAPKTMMFEKPRPRTNEMARIRRTQDGFEVTRTQQAMAKLDQQFFAAEEALNATFPMPNAKGMKRQQEKKNKNVVKSVRGTVEFLVHANGRTFTPTYNMVGVLTAVEVSDGFVLARGERGDSSWTMTDKDGNSVEEDPIVGVAFDKKGNLWYETADGRRTTFNVDGTTKTAMKD